ncbi:phage tail tape measure protein [Paenibacillus naphthalenovorans]|uniref:phage tail tape measure protein n=1 Tax=Paenibacillus naphthalenovorans TaxID=162209 RepID=UPI0008875B0B|nr:phage tail tape measure protein [Paenibacillus naphthalenovorans]SDI49073.1 phage tail tape measure protein, TP901 family, core region [Paenibacillus naphthalenovorans]
MSTSMQVALVLTAVNNMGTTIRAVKQQVSDLGASYDALRQKVQKMNDLRASGIKDAAAGAAMLAPIESSVKAAANLEYAIKRLEIAQYDASKPAEELKKQLKELEALAVKLGADTAFSSKEAADGMTTLIRAGMDVKDVLAGGAAAAIYLAQTAEVAPVTAAESIAKMSNMFKVNGDQLMQVADDINRASNASSAGVQEIMYSMQLAGMSANTLGLTAKETSLLIGTLFNQGLNNLSGSSLNNLLLALTKIDDQAGEAMAKLGMLKNATFEKKQDGTWKIKGGEGAVFNDKGQIKSAQALVDTVRAAFKSNGVELKDIVDSKGNLLPKEQLDQLASSKQNVAQTLLLFKQAFGEEGMRAAIALAAEGKGSYEATTEAAKQSMEIQKQVNELQATTVGLFEQMQGAWETFNASSGGVVLDEVKQLAKKGLELIDVLAKWTAAHPQLTRVIIQTIAGLALLRIGIGALKIVQGVVLGPLFSMGGGFIRFGKYVGDATKAFTFFRTVGNGVFTAGLKALFKDFPILQQLIQGGARALSSLGRVGWNGFMFLVRGAGSGLMALGRFGVQGAVWLARIGASFLTVGVQALLMGARIALAWFIGMGPIGWIILGVTAIITGAILAWKNNFLGFRDKITAIWEWIKSNWPTLILAAINPIGGIIMGVLNLLPYDALEWGKNMMKMIADGIKKGIDWVKEAVTNAGGIIKKFLGFSSPTEAGPASNSDQWAPNFMKMFAGGIDAGLPSVAKSVKGTAAQICSGLSDIQVAAPTVPTANIPNMDNVIPFPASLPRIERPNVPASDIVPFPQRMGQENKTLLQRPQGGMNVNDNRKIDITIYANDAKEAEIGVRRAVDDKYIASRGVKKQVWQGA